MERIDITADGDIVLQFRNSTELLVSSHILRSGSPVFKSMVGPSFSEGQTLNNSSASQPKIIPLPEDEPEGMKLPCYILHRRNGLVPISVDDHHFLSFAKAIGKYGCTIGVKHAVKAFFSHMAPALSQNTRVLWLSRRTILTMRRMPLSSQRVMRSNKTGDYLNDDLADLTHLESVKGCSLVACYPDILSRRFAKHVADLEQYANTTCTGSCRDCFKAGGKFEGECRTPHRK